MVAGEIQAFFAYIVDSTNIDFCGFTRLTLPVSVDVYVGVAPLDEDELPDKLA